MEYFTDLKTGAGPIITRSKKPTKIKKHIKQF